MMFYSRKGVFGRQEIPTRDWDALIYVPTFKTAMADKMFLAPYRVISAHTEHVLHIHIKK